MKYTESSFNRSEAIQATATQQTMKDNVELPSTCISKKCTKFKKTNTVTYKYKYK